MFSSPEPSSSIECFNAILNCDVKSYLSVGLASGRTGTSVNDGGNCDSENKLDREMGMIPGECVITTLLLFDVQPFYCCHHEFSRGLLLGNRFLLNFLLLFLPN